MIAARGTGDPFAGIIHADNPEQRCACVLVLDRSTSMAGAKIEQLNCGLKQFREELTADDSARRRLELATVPFGPVVRDAAFRHPDEFSDAPLEIGTHTPMGEALEYAVDLVARRKAGYKSSGLSYVRPWILLMTDGEPTDCIRRAGELIRQGETEKKFMFFAVGVDGANSQLLRSLSVRPPLRLQGVAFRDFFIWLSCSLSKVSQSAPSATIDMPLPQCVRIDT